METLRKASKQVMQAGAGNDCMGNCVPDYLFRCSYCIKLIAEDSPVYMREDHSYCTLKCRDKGLSKLFTQLKETQLQEAWTRASSGLSLHKTQSTSSFASKTTRCTGSDSSTQGTKQAGVFARLGQVVLDVVLQRVASRSWGEKALRTYSSGILWGREFLQSHASAQTLFEYFPEVDHYLSDPKLSSRYRSLATVHSLRCLSTACLVDKYCY